MKKNLIILTNILIVAGILAFVVHYAQNETREFAEAQTNSFAGMTAVMEQVTANT